MGEQLFEQHAEHERVMRVTAEHEQRVVRAGPEDVVDGSTQQTAPDPLGKLLDGALWVAAGGLSVTP